MFSGLIFWLNVLWSWGYARTVLPVLSHKLTFPSGEIAKTRLMILQISQDARDSSLTLDRQQLVPVCDFMSVL